MMANENETVTDDQELTEEQLDDLLEIDEGGAEEEVVAVAEVAPEVPPEATPEPEPAPEQAAATEETPSAPAETPEVAPATPEAEAEPAPPQAAPLSAGDVLNSMGLLPEGFKAAEPTPAEPAPAAAPAATEVAVQPEPPKTPTYDEVVNQQIETLASQHYALDQETVEALKAEGNEQLVEFVPKFAARIFVDAVQATVAQVAQTMPTMIAQYNSPVSYTHLTLPTKA